MSQWIALLRDGDQQAAALLWKRLMHRLQILVRPRIHGAAYDEEDVALSAFAVFCRGLAEGRYPELSDRDQLWNVLATITLSKARDRFKAETSKKRGGHSVVGSGGADINDIPDGELGPEADTLMADQCRHLLDLLHSDRLENVVLLKLDGYTNQEIAARMGLTRWSIGRMLNCVRKIWETQLEDGAT